jgi:hypothetical protein
LKTVIIPHTLNNAEDGDIHSNFAGCSVYMGMHKTWPLTRREEQMFENKAVRKILESEKNDILSN